MMVILAAAMMMGCSKKIDFHEEVLLSDGTKIKINRFDHLRRACESFSCDWALDFSEIQIEGARYVSWKKRLIPLLLDKYRDRYFLITTISSCRDKEFGNPKPAYIQFELTESGWIKSEFNPIFYGRTANLLIAPDWDAGEVRMIDVPTKESRNKMAGVPKFLKTLSPVTINNC